jgi:protein SCO1
MLPATRNDGPAVLRGNKNWEGKAMQDHLHRLAGWATVKRPPKSYLIVACAVFITIVLGVAAASLAMNRFISEEVGAPLLGINGHFTLMTPDGSTVTDQNFRGKWLLIYFGYTFCPDLCPTALSDISVALQQLGPMADKVQPLFITVDPERDTPQVIADYVGSFDRRLIGLRGTPEQTLAVAAAYHVYYATRKLGDNGEYTVDHSSFIYVINPQGQFVKLLTDGLPGHPMADELRQLIR